jgi:hypothetical protein
MYEVLPWILANALNLRYLSAHSLTVNIGGGFTKAATSLSFSLRARCPSGAVSN